MRSPRRAILTFTGALAAAVISVLFVLWQLGSIATLIAFVLDRLMPVTALLTLLALGWLFLMIDSGNRGEDATSERLRALNSQGQGVTEAPEANPATASHPSLTVELALTESSALTSATALGQVRESHARLIAAVDATLSVRELSYHRYRCLADNLLAESIERARTLAGNPARAVVTAVDHELAQASDALDTAASELNALASTTGGRTLRSVTDEMSALALRTPRLAR